MKTWLWDILFPPLCLNCQKNAEGDLCPECWAGIRLNTSLFCPVCGLRLADNKKVCHKDSPYLLAAATNYDNDSIRTLLKLFKFKKWQRLQRPLGEILVSYLRNLDLDIRNFTVVPIPLHEDREKERGFNQAKLIAKIVADFYKLDLTEPIQRIKNTKTQSLAKNHEERAQNVINCFAVNYPELIVGKNILLVDDVHTSGATIREAAKTLKSAGAKKIIALVIAKTR
ncbi:MAG: ComF family protein [bacterium]|nr:ComF family protein [bacterium]